MVWRRLAALLLVLATAGSAFAHTRSQSVSQWTIDGTEASVTLRVGLLELTRIPDADVTGRRLDAWLGAYASTRLVLSADGTPCDVVGTPAVLRPADDRVSVVWRVRCGAIPDALASDFLLDVATGHVHFAQVRRGDVRTERLLSAGRAHWTFAAPTGATNDGGFGQYVRLGLGHIVTGLDHLAFLLALLLVGRSGREAVIVVTGFTVGHSITLAIAALDLLQPVAPAVEALIGLSIVLVALEATAVHGAAAGWGGGVALVLVTLAVLRLGGVGLVPAVSLAGVAVFAACHFPLLAMTGHPARVRASVALLFGLVHGLGFGGFLLEVGLPPTGVAVALLGFNVGVELGQVMLVLLAWPLLGRLGARPRDLGLAGVTALGCYWFVLRAYG